jgi:hypothetical protein
MPANVAPVCVMTAPHPAVFERTGPRALAPWHRSPQRPQSMVAASRFTATDDIGGGQLCGAKTEPKGNLPLIKLPGGTSCAPARLSAPPTILLGEKHAGEGARSGLRPAFFDPGLRPDQPGRYGIGSGCYLRSRRWFAGGHEIAASWSSGDKASTKGSAPFRICGRHSHRLEFAEQHLATAIRPRQSSTAAVAAVGSRPVRPSAAYS